MAAHRYWRLFVIHNDNTEFCGFHKCQMADTPAGPNLCTNPASANQSAFGFGQEGQFAFDYGSSNGWRVGTFGGFNNYGYGQWLSYDFGAGNEKDISEVRLIPSDGNATRTPYTFRVQSSDDAVSWADEWVVYFTGWTLATYTTFSKPAAFSGSARYWAVYGLQASPPNTDPLCEYSEVAMRADQLGPNLCTGGTPFGWRVDGAAALAFDGNVNTSWQGVGYAQTTSGMLIGYDFGAATSIGWIDLTNANTTDFNRHTRANNQGEIWVSDDGRNFAIQGPFAVDAWTAPTQTRGFEIAVGLGAIVDSLFLVGINTEYEIPNRYVRFGVGLSCMAITPLIIQSGD